MGDGALADAGLAEELGALGRASEALRGFLDGVDDFRAG